MHTGDTAELPGVAVLARDLMMTSPEATAAMVADAVTLAGR